MNGTDVDNLFLYVAEECLKNNQQIAVPEEFASEQYAPEKPDYSFLMKVMAHPATKVVAAVVVVASLILLGVVSGGLVPLAIGVGVGLAGLASGVGMFAGSRFCELSRVDSAGLNKPASL